MAENSDPEDQIKALDETPKQDIPEGLEILVNLPQIFVKQELELMEIHCHCEGRNHYSIRDDKNREIMKANETTCCCFLRCCCNCCGVTSRPFEFTVDDFNGHKMYFSRKTCCNNCWCPCCLNKVKVTMHGETLGWVKQRWSLCKTYYYIKDGHGRKVLKISGPCRTTGCCCADVTFTIYTIGGDEVGKITKKWAGIMQEAFTDADNFGIQFPVDLDVKIKAVLISACLLIDFMFFENSPKE